jgi:hypothetical protein
MFAPTDLLSQRTWLPVKNANAAEAPAYALLRVTGIGTDGVVTVDQSDADDKDPTMLLVNGPAKIPAGQYGQATVGQWERALYDTGDGTPALGEDWGAGNASWKLRKGKVGFKAWGGVDSGSAVFARPASFPCHDPGAPPGGWTASDDACYADFTDRRCTDGVTEYQLVRLFTVNGKFRTWSGPWGTTFPPDTP